jgi:hypothetical protein
MLQFFHNSALTIGNTQAYPKIFLSPTAGLTNKTSIIYLGDPYIVELTATAAISATTLHVTATDEFLASGTAQVIHAGTPHTVTYTGKTISTLTGVSGVTVALSVGDTVKPWKVYKTPGNFTFTPTGPNLNTLQISVGSSSSSYSFPGTTCIFTSATFDSIADSPIPVYISVGCNAGPQADFPNWAINSGPIYTRDLNDSTAIGVTEVGITVICYGDVFRRDEFQVNSLRLLPASQALPATSPGFVLGTYRWRDDTTVNSVVTIPTVWDSNVAALGLISFVSGIGCGTDLQPIDVENSGNSIYLRIQNGFYWDEATRYYLPATPYIEFINANQVAVTLKPGPNITTPVFVGVWYLDNNGFYRTLLEFRYQPSQTFNVTSEAPTYQYTLNRKTNLLTLNNNLPQQTYFLGTLSGLATDYFNLPVYPIDSIVSVFVNRGVGNINLYSNNFVFDRNAGTLSITAPTAEATSIPGANPGEPVYAVCNPAYAVVYDSGDTEQRLLTSIDLNPAFSGISSGYVYLQHRRQTPVALTLSCDKPIIDIPATYASVIDLVAYGPIYFNGDYSLLTVQAFGPLGNEVIPNATIQMIPGANFSGTLNYKNPNSTAVTGITGSDGKANFLYVPDPNYGYYIPTIAAAGGNGGLATTTLTNDSLVLPTGVPIAEIYNTKEGWLVSTYNIMNNDPLFGMTSANTAEGQLPFITNGTAGTVGYSTNGQKVLWSIGPVPIYPIDARDSSNVSYLSGGFSGIVSKLVYATAVDTASTVGAYFVTFTQLVSLQAQVVNTDVLSNTILLEMAVPNTINQDPWLTLNDATQGILNQYRLGWQLDLPDSI